MSKRASSPSTMSAAGSRRDAALFFSNDPRAKASWSGDSKADWCLPVCWVPKLFRDAMTASAAGTLSLVYFRVTYRSQEEPVTS